jgi:hypothetical protein
MLITHPIGNYQFLKGIGPYSSGAIAAPGYEIIHNKLIQPLPLHLAFEKITQHLNKQEREIQALCGMQLRIPEPLSFEGFSEFNQEYQQKLTDLGLFLDDINPLARTNIAVPELQLQSPMLYSFSYTAPSTHPNSTFIVAGAGDLSDQTNLSPAAIVRPGETSEEALKEKASVVMQVMQERLSGLGATWSMASCVDVYTSLPIHSFLDEIILKPIGQAAWHGVNWFYGEPPIAGLAFEMDLRGVRKELWM